MNRDRNEGYGWGREGQERGGYESQGDDHTQRSPYYGARRREEEWGSSSRYGGPRREWRGRDETYDRSMSNFDEDWRGRGYGRDDDYRTGYGRTGAGGREYGGSQGSLSYPGAGSRSGRYGKSEYGSSYPHQSTGRYERGEQGRFGGRFEGRESEREQEGQEEGGFFRRMGEGIRSAFGMGERERGPYFGKGPKGYRRSDERIREEVSEVIARQGWIDATDVEVKVQSGEVTLTGTVQEREHKRHLEQMIEEVHGVDDVRNELRVKPRTETHAAGTTYGTSAESERTMGRNIRSS